MGKKRQRFDYSEIVQRIEEARTRQGRTTKELCATAKLTPDRWYRKMKATGNSFTLEELGRIADAFDAPPGWPFVDWAAGEAMTRAIGGRS